MKKLIALLVIAALCVCSAALAEEGATSEEGKFHTLIEDGEFIIQVDSEGDLAWMADGMEQDPSVVELAFEDTVEDTYVARYAPVNDGEVTVAVRHYTGPACDEIVTYDLRVADGAVQEVTGGSYAVTPAYWTMDLALLGEWVEDETQFARMTVEKNPERGYDITVVSPVSHGAYVFKASVLFDCERDALVYDKGKFWDIDGEYDGSAELGEARTAGTTGSIASSGDDGRPTLDWHDDVENPEGSILFVRGE